MMCPFESQPLSQWISLENS